jgi:hypothetical protein
MRLPNYRNSITRSSVGVVATSFLLLALACGPEDYRQPIRGFEEASEKVIAADRAFLSNMNTIEQNLFIDRMVFEQKPFGPADIDKTIIITRDEIRLRTAALGALSRYTENLAILASGKAAGSIGEDTKELSTNLQGLATDATKFNPGNSAFYANFSGVASAAASAIGAVAQLIVERKARVEIEKSVKNSDKDVTALIQLISDDAQGAYLRQQNQLGAYGLELYRDYDCEVSVDTPPPPKPGEVECPRREKGVQADPIALLSLADRIKSYRAQQAALDEANPARAIARMQKAHEVLVAYVNSNKNPQSLRELVSGVQDFVSAAQPLDQAIKDLVAANK